MRTIENVDKSSQELFDFENETEYFILVVIKVHTYLNKPAT